RRQAASVRMTAEPDIDPSPAAMTAHEPARRSGSIVLVLLVAGGIVAAAIALMSIGHAQAQPYILGLLALLAMVGLFTLFAFAAGIIRFADRAADDPVTGRIADQAYDGLAVTDSRGHVVYVNATLANWLDHDLAEIGSGGLKLKDIVSGDGASLLTSIAAVPGE